MRRSPSAAAFRAIKFVEAAVIEATGALRSTMSRIRKTADSFFLEMN